MQANAHAAIQQRAEQWAYDFGEEVQMSGDLNGACQFLGACPHGSKRGFRNIQTVTQLCCQFFCRDSWQHPGCGALEQLATDRRLQPCKMLRCSGLGNPQRTRSGADGALSIDFDKRVQTLEHHKWPIINFMGTGRKALRPCGQHRSIRLITALRRGTGWR